MNNSTTAQNLNQLRIEVTGALFKSPRKDYILLNHLRENMQRTEMALEEASKREGSRIMYQMALYWLDNFSSDLLIAHHCGSISKTKYSRFATTINEIKAALTIHTPNQLSFN